MKWRRAVAVAFLLSVSGGAAAAPEGIKLGEFIPALPPQPAPQISFADLAGNAAALGDFRGKPVLINLWATWCQPCLREMPSLQRLQAALGDGLVLLAISQDRGGARIVEPFVAQQGLDKLRVYLDPKSEVGHAFAVRGLPTSILIDADGRVVGRVEGAAEWDAPAFLAIVRPLLAPPGERPVKGAWR